MPPFITAVQGTRHFCSRKALCLDAEKSQLVHKQRKRRDGRETEYKGDREGKYGRWKVSGKLDAVAGTASKGSQLSPRDPRSVKESP